MTKTFDKKAYQKDYYAAHGSRPNEQTVWRHTSRVKCIEYKGGVCTVCGLKYDGTNGAIFDFHHVDQTQKEFVISRMSRKWESLKPELDKCDLVCANCHRVYHAGSY